ncbi:MAG: hypothetical protein WBX16_12355 [Candidatus Acidiferrales bacterium]
MGSVALSSIVFACVVGGAVLGSALRVVLPEHQLSADSRDAVKLGMGLVGTMAALVLGLLIASAKTSFDTQSTELTHISSQAVVLDRILAHYGLEANEARDVLRASLEQALDQMWPKERARSQELVLVPQRSEIVYDRMVGLSPKDDAQRTLQPEALTVVMALAQTRWLIYEQRATAISVPFLIVLVFWIPVIFISFGLFAPLNATVVASFLVPALSVSSAIFLILEMYTPYEGLIHVSSVPLRAALAQLGRFQYPASPPGSFCRESSRFSYCRPIS